MIVLEQKTNDAKQQYWKTLSTAALHKPKSNNTFFTIFKYYNLLINREIYI